MLEFASWVPPMFTALAFAVLAVALVRVSRETVEATQSVEELSEHIAALENRRRVVLGLTGGEPMAANLEDIAQQIADLHTRNAAFQRQVNDRLSNMERESGAAHQSLTSGVKELWDRVQAAPAPDSMELYNKAQAHSDAVSGERFEKLYAMARQSFLNIDIAFSDLKGRVEAAEIAASEATKLGVEVANARAMSKAAMDVAVKTSAANADLSNKVETALAYMDDTRTMARAVTPLLAAHADLERIVGENARYAVDTRKGVSELADFAARTDAVANETAKVVVSLPSPVDLRAAMLGANIAAEKAEKAATDAAGVSKTVEALTTDTSKLSQYVESIAELGHKRAEIASIDRQKLASVADELNTAIANMQWLRADLAAAREDLGSVGKQGMAHHDRIESVTKLVDTLKNDSAEAIKAVNALTVVATDAVRRATDAESIASKVASGAALEVDAVLERSIVGTVAQEAATALELAERVSASQSQLTSRVTGLSDAVTDNGNKISAVQRAIEAEMTERMRSDVETRVGLGSAVDNLTRVAQSLSGAYGEVAAKVEAGITDKRVDILLSDIAAIKAAVAKVEFTK